MSKTDIIDNLYQRHLEKDPCFYSLVETDDVKHEHAMKDFVRQCLENVETKIGIFAHLYVTTWSKGSNSVSDLQTYSAHCEQYSLQCFKNRISDLCTEGEGQSTDIIHVSTGSHRMALRTCHLDLVQNLDFIGTTLLDDLIACHLMEESDVRSIVAESRPKSRAEAFLRRVQVMFSERSFVDSFLPILAKYSPEIATKLSLCLQNDTPVPDFSRCYNCQVKDIVEPCLLADLLYTNGIIDSNLHQDLRKDSISNKEKWDRLAAKDPRDIIECLKLKFPAVYEEFDLGNAQSFDCLCHLIITQPFRMLPSCEELLDGTTSNCDVGNIADLESVLADTDDAEKDSLSSEDELEQTVPGNYQPQRTEIKYPESKIGFLFEKDVGTTTTNPCLTDENNDNKNDSEEEQLDVLMTDKNNDRRESIELIYSREDEEETQREQGFGQGIKSFLNKYLFTRLRYQQTAKVMRNTVVSSQFDYDVYLIYKEFSPNMQHCLHHLESVLNLRVCIKERDFLAGSLIVSNVIDGIENSRKTVLLWSDSWLEDRWFSFEYDTALQHTIDLRQDPPIILMYEQTDLSKAPRDIGWRLRRGDFFDCTTERARATTMNRLAEVLKK